MSDYHEGGCLCGAVRYRVRGQAARNSACHCTLTPPAGVEVFEKGTLPPPKK